MLNLRREGRLGVGQRTFPERDLRQDKLKQPA